MSTRPPRRLTGDGPWPGPERQRRGRGGGPEGGIDDSGRPLLAGRAGKVRPVGLAQFQALMERTYGARDLSRGRAATVAWLAEEMGELAQATRKGTADEQLHEIGDVLAWVASLANQLGLSLEAAVARYVDAGGCPRCRCSPCDCPLPPG